MKKNYCSICKRKLGFTRYTWWNGLIGLKDIKNICEECDMSVTEQIVNIKEELNGYN